MNVERRFFAIVAVFIVGLGSACWKVRQALDPYPPDAVSIESFNRNREHFKELIDLLEKDSNISNIDANGRATSRDVKPLEFPEARRQRYIELMNATGALHVSRTSWKQDSKTVFFQMWWVPNGLLMQSKAKYLVYKIDTEPQFVDSLDPIYESGRDANEFRRIDDDWSLYLDVW